MSNSNDSQTKSRVNVRLSEKEINAFRVACAINNDTAQEVLYRAVIEYVRATKLPNDALDI